MATITSATFRNSVLNNMFKKPSGGGFGYSSIYVGLSTAEPRLDSSEEITNVVEPVGMGYKRAAISKTVSGGTSSAMGSADKGIITNVEEVHFNQVSEDAAEVGWGTIGYWALFSSQTGGAPLVAGPLENAISATRGKVVVIKAPDAAAERPYGDLKVEFPGTFS